MPYPIENLQLWALSFIIKLIVESFKYIKENDYLNFNFLQVLPIKEDNLAIFYEPILFRAPLKID